MTTAKMYVLAEAHRRRLLPLDLACWADVLSWVAVAEVRTILGWCQGGSDVDARLPLLSTWLGHTAPHRPTGTSARHRNCSH